MHSYRILGFEYQHRTALMPIVDIPASEQWLFDNPIALQQVKQGLRDAQEGRVVKKSFSEYLSNED